MAEGKAKRLLTLREVERVDQQVLGKGAYGVVYAVKYNRKVCAAKQIHPIFVEDQVNPDEKKKVEVNFLRECEQCRDLCHPECHPNIVEFLGVYYPQAAEVHSNIPVMVMELMDKSLTAYLEDNKSVAETTLSVKASILLDVARGLTYLHTRSPAVMHRDLSPNNVLLKKVVNKSGELLIAKIADLGVAKAIRAEKKSTQSKLSMMPGTQDFMPPEATQDNPIYDLSIDVFSFGGIVLFVATHKWPSPTSWLADPYCDEPKALTEVQRRKKYLDQMSGKMKDLKSLVMSCLSNNPSKRPTMDKVYNQLTEFKCSIPLPGRRYNDNYVELDFINRQYPKLRPSKKSTDDLAIDAVKKPSTARDSSEHLWYVGSISFAKVKNMLSNVYDGVFLVHEDDTQKGEYEICLRWGSTPQRIKIFINPKTNHFYLTNARSFSTIYELVEYYQKNSLSTVSPDIATTLKYAYYIVRSPPKRPILVPWHNSPATIRQLRSNTTPVQLNEEDKLLTKGKGFMEKFRLSWRMSRKQIDCSSDRALNASYQKINEELWYHDRISHTDIDERLKEDGDYLVRFSENRQCYVLTAMCEGEATHFQIKEIKRGGGYSLCGPTFPSIGDLLRHYIESRIVINEQTQAELLLKRPIIKQATTEQCFNNIVPDKDAYSKDGIARIFSAALKDTGEHITVKVCHSEKQDFLNEAKLMEQFNHPNIVKLLSVCTEPMYFVLELMSGGDFLSFLRKHGTYQTRYQLTKYSLDAALGMEYLASQSCLHRNLTARSCLVGNNNEVLKISDFSMCIQSEKGIFIQTDEITQTPIRWTAPETFQLGIYTTASDVWSYGVLLFQAYSCGKVPYFETRDIDIQGHLREGKRMPAPVAAPKVVYDEVMLKCWCYIQKERPTFKDVVVKLNSILVQLPRQ